VLGIDAASLKAVAGLSLGMAPERSDPARERVFTRSAHTSSASFRAGPAIRMGMSMASPMISTGMALGTISWTTAPCKGGRDRTLQVERQEPQPRGPVRPAFCPVLMRTDPIPAAELQDLATFIKSQPPPRWERKRKQTLTPARSEGNNFSSPPRLRKARSFRGNAAARPAIGPRCLPIAS